MGLKVKHIWIDCVTLCVGVRWGAEKRQSASGRHCMARTKGKSWQTEAYTEKPGTKLAG